jgi:hypothetical protein
MVTLTVANAAPILNTESPVGFFTNVASRLLSSELNLDLMRIQIYPTNQYTPAVHQLLQVTANIYDATTTNFYPSVFRPLFTRDLAGNVFVTGYTNVPSVSGANDIAFSTPFDVSTISALGGTNVLENVYGVPWIIGAKKGFPNFNKFAMQDVVQITRKLQIRRSHIPTTSVSDFMYTNQMYIFSVSNSIGIDCWNSYSNSYPNPVQIVVNDNLSMTLTNDAGAPSLVLLPHLITTNIVLNSPWPGSAWNPVVHNGFPSANSFIIPLNNTVVFLTNSAFYSGTTPPGVRGFYPVADNLGWETNKHDFAFPQFGLLTTNRLQVFMLDGTNVIDYVQFAGPESSRYLNVEFQNTNMTVGYANMWSTNVNANGVPWGINSQIDISDGNVALDPTYWSDVSAQDEISGFRDFMGYGPANGSSTAQFYKTNYIVQVPYSPKVTASEYISWQANDPLVHYLASDLNFQGTESGGPTTGISVTTRNLLLPRPNFNVVNDRYQPWGRNSQMAVIANVDTTPANLAFKDPLVRESDYWDFPTNESSFGDWLGQIHRGTPWQTIYLKASDILGEIKNGTNVGTNTWMNWTGDFDPTDTAAMAPVRDRHLVSVLAALLNTNDLRSLFSVNNSNPNAWLVCFDGLTALTNNLPDNSPQLRFGLITPQFEFGRLDISSNSPQALVIVSAIQSARASRIGQFFYDLGDILAIPQLTEQSPFLNWNDGVQSSNGISDEAYEIIPSQLLSLLRVDSIGSIASVNSQTVVQFTGYDGHAYAVQVSSDLINWISINTNYPVNGMFSFTNSAAPNTSPQFYRSILLQ